MGPAKAARAGGAGSSPEGREGGSSPEGREGQDAPSLESRTRPRRALGRDIRSPVPVIGARGQPTTSAVRDACNPGQKSTHRSGLKAPRSTLIIVNGLSQRATDQDPSITGRPGRPVTETVGAGDLRFETPAAAERSLDSTTRGRPRGDVPKGVSSKDRRGPPLYPVARWDRQWHRFLKDDQAAVARHRVPARRAGPQREAAGPQREAAWKVIRRAPLPGSLLTSTARDPGTHGVRWAPGL